MFRAAQANPFEDAVVKATDENLTAENWEYILDVCDRVGASDTGAKDAVGAMIKRLAHRNANVQLYTLELANALSQNCGIPMHKELASRSFTDALLRLTSDRNTHNQVKAKILERMAEWTEMFSRDADLGIMEQAYMRLKSQNPNLHAPSKPYKREITDVDRQKEEEELQMALALSIREKPGAGGAPQPRKDSLPADKAGTQNQQKPAALPSGTTAATVSRVRALYDFTPSEAGELAFRKGDIIAVLESVYKDWWKGSLRGQTGIFPLNYVEKLQDPTDDEIQREAQMEAEVFGQIKNVEKLLALLSTSSSESNARDNDEITSLYHQTTAIRPKLVELIQKYSQKKDDFTQLNEKFIKARKDYEALLDASMSQPHQYGRPPPGPSYGVPINQGYPPPQQQQPPPQQQQQQPPPQRYYPPTNQQESDPLYSQPTGAPAAFYMIPPGQQAPPHGQAHDQRIPKPTSPVYGQHPQGPPPPQSQPQQQQQPPPNNRQSMYGGGNLQELATSHYDTPSYPPTQQHLTQQQAQYSPVAQHDQHEPYYAAPPQPSTAPPPPPAGAAGPGSPNMSGNMPHFAQQPPPQQQQQQPPQQYQAYQAYQPPRQDANTPNILRAGQQDASDFYR